MNNIFRLPYLLVKRVRVDKFMVNLFFWLVNILNMNEGLNDQK